MGLRFRRSWKIAPGIRLNLGRKSASVSFGGRGARYTVSTTGRRTATVGIPGTGISCSKTTGAAARGKDGTAMNRNTAQKKTRTGRPFYKKRWVWGVVAILLAVGMASGGGETAQPDLPAESGQTEALEQGGDAAVTDPAQPEREEPEEVGGEQADSGKAEPAVSADGAAAEAPASSVTQETPKQEQPKADPAPEPAQTEPETTSQPVSAPENQPEAPAATQPEASAPAATQSQMTYVGSVESDRYHTPTCRWAKKILEENRVYFSTREEAAGAGYSPCGTCKP